MKIRMRAHHEQVRNANLVQEENPLRSYWITQGDLAGMSIAYHQPDWEPVPEERWVDVTVECEEYSGVLCHRAEQVTEPNGYLLRKVQLWTVQPNTNIVGEAHWAFIVEKKEA